MKIGNTKIKSMIFYIIILVLTFLVYTVEGSHSDFKVFMTNILIVILSLTFMVMGDPYNYSLNKIFMLFSFFFFGIAPILQYQYGKTIWRGSAFNDQDYFRMNIVIIIILLLYQFLYYIFSILKPSYTLKKNNDRKVGYISVSKKNLLTLSLLSMFITLYLNDFNLLSLFLRSTGTINRLLANQSVRLIYSNFVRPIPVISLILFKINNIKDKKTEIILLLIGILTNFPTSAPRFYIAAIYIPLIILYIKGFTKRYLLLNKLLLIGLLFIFPFLDQARGISNFSNFKLSLDFKMFLDGHFDSFQMFMRVINENYITRGKQLLTTILFFIPRGIWPSKSIGSGSLMSSNLGLSFDNISMNYFGEGYINFGYLGIFIFIFIIAYANAKLDKKYWYNLNNYKRNSPYYLLLIGLEFFILRGDLLSSFAFTIGLLGSVYFVNKVSIKKIK